MTGAFSGGAPSSFLHAARWRRPQRRGALARGGHISRIDTDALRPPQRLLPSVTDAPSSFAAGRGTRRRRVSGGMHLEEEHEEDGEGGRLTTRKEEDRGEGGKRTEEGGRHSRRARSTSCCGDRRVQASGSAHLSLRHCRASAYTLLPLRRASLAGPHRRCAGSRSWRAASTRTGLTRGTAGAEAEQNEGSLRSARRPGTRRPGRRRKK
ncbi:hypothetical protein DFH09DRAFT_200207 [Mycena vulgaris]|nr:hypothetical protein DFH09DRAFT_200207 [Mycena vulgaris]